MHPFRADLDGKDLTGFKDPAGKALFVEMVQVCRDKGEGKVDYIWQWKDDKTRLEPKMSYVKAFAPWGWIVGTGVYVNDVAEQISSIRKTLLLVIIPVSILLLGLLIIPLRSLGAIRQVMVQLNESSDEVASASHQVSSSSQSLAQGASEQAASLEETSASLEELSSMTRQNADHAHEADRLMSEMNRVVTRANSSMSATKNSMDAVHQAGGDIAKIIKTIDAIAFQTNLLALNAAVEAARAGEAGLGFAVVADEVRSLAQRAAAAAKNTSELIETTVNRIQEGSEQVRQTETAFQEVTDSSKKVGELVGEISQASQEQAQGLDQINQAISQMDQVVQSNAANAEESAAAGEELNAQAQLVREVVLNLARIMGENLQALQAASMQSRRQAPQLPGKHAARVPRALPPESAQLKITH
jgi:methyl-accepting chemotaxis protein